jgi:hypothetical protein
VISSDNICVWNHGQISTACQAKVAVNHQLLGRLPAPLIK